MLLRILPLSFGLETVEGINECGHTLIEILSSLKSLCLRTPRTMSMRTFIECNLEIPYKSIYWAYWLVWKVYNGAYGSSCVCLLFCG